MTLKLAIFDCDGTLVDSQAAILDATAAAFADLDLPVPDAAAVRAVIGLSLADAIAVLAPHLSAAGQALLVQRYRAAATRIGNGGHQPETLFDGIGDVLDALDAAGVLLAIATGKGRRALDQTLDIAALHGRFVATVTADDAVGKPAPDMAMRALTLCGVDAADAVVIGDTEYDIAMARSAGIAAIGVTWGHHPPMRLLDAGAACVVDRPDRLTGSILGLLKGETPWAEA